jgi:hypothetical protein
MSTNKVASAIAGAFVVEGALLVALGGAPADIARLLLLELLVVAVIVALVVLIRIAVSGVDTEGG